MFKWENHKVTQLILKVRELLPLLEHSELIIQQNVYLWLHVDCVSKSYVLSFSSRRSLQSRQRANTVIWISNRQRLLASANVNASQVKGSSSGEIIMVDPIEAKQLAAKQMREIQAKEKLKRRRQAEAVNGTLAMIGLTAGLVIEGQTGKGILGQLTGYWDAIATFFTR
ncbi:hypothetical protein BHE74_00019542 [Ensete ventricosum]|nr:hypothetical protein BHE74_00019542 [Ensete ventricosum]